MKLNKEYQIKRPSLELAEAEIEQLSKEATENPEPMPDDVKAKLVALLAEVREVERLYAIIHARIEEQTPEKLQGFLRLGFFCAGGKGRPSKAALESYEVKKAVVDLVMAVLDGKGKRRPCSSPL